MRPCPYAGCRHHLGFEVRKNGSIVEVQSDKEIWDMEHTCSLDIADDGPHTLDELGELFGLTKERVRQIEEAALAKLHAILDEDHVFGDFVADGKNGPTFPVAPE